jgi:hypothetical protein
MTEHRIIQGDVLAGLYICTRSSKTAPGCDYFKKRAVAA